MLGIDESEVAKEHTCSHDEGGAICDMAGTSGDDTKM